MVKKILNALGADIWLVPLLLVGAWMAYNNHFIQDDAYISFRYARNFAQGYGLVWQEGSREYGYTNFLFTLLVGIFMLLRVPPECAAFLITIAAYLCSLIIVFRIAIRFGGGFLIAYLVTLLLACNVTFSAYATGGLETSFQCALILATYYQLLVWTSEFDAKSLRLIAVFSAVALLVRLDSALLLYPVYAVIALKCFEFYKRDASLKRSLIRLFIMVCLPPVTAVLLLLLFSSIYYGHPLPNSYYVKISSEWHINQGINYFMGYNAAECFAPAFLLLWIALTVQKTSWAEWVIRGILAAPIVIWSLYLLYIGGDFMEYRLLVPILPFFYLICVQTIFSTAMNLTEWRIFTFLSLIILSFLAHRYSYYNMDDNDPRSHGIESIGTLDSFLHEGTDNWINIGEKLHQLFYTGHKDDVIIAMTPAGAIPYFSQLRSLDQLGLNTYDIRYKSIPFLDFPGHRLRITTDYLREKKINLIIDHPMFSRFSTSCRDFPNSKSHMPIHGVPILFIPLSNDSYFIAYYLTPHPRIDQLIAQRKILKCRG